MAGWANSLKPQDGEETRGYMNGWKDGRSIDGMDGLVKSKGRGAQLEIGTYLRNPNLLRLH